MLKDHVAPPLRRRGSAAASQAQAGRRPLSAGSPLETDWTRSVEVERLFGAILHLRTPDECAAFFRDLCTIPELVTLAHRWQVAQLLEEGLPYHEIARRTGASTATITRINTWRRFGTGGYRLALERTRGRAR